VTSGRPRLARIGSGLIRPSTGRVGLDVAGTVEQVAPDVTELHPGDEVWADLFADGRGSLAEYVCASARAFAPKPADVTFETAATVPHSGLLALQGLRVGAATQPGDDVLINGAGGGVGPFAIQIAKASGATVTAVDHAGTLEILRELDAMSGLLNAGDVVPRVDRRFPLAEAADAFRHLQSGQARRKIIITPPVDG